MTAGADMAGTDARHVRSVTANVAEAVKAEEEMAEELESLNRMLSRLDAANENRRKAVKTCKRKMDYLSTRL